MTGLRAVDSVFHQPVDGVPREAAWRIRAMIENSVPVVGLTLFPFVPRLSRADSTESPLPERETPACPAHP